MYETNINYEREGGEREGRERGKESVCVRERERMREGREKGGKSKTDREREERE